MTPARRITARDVARAAGVSPTTVSYVLNATPGQTIPESTRRRVHQAADALRYSPSLAARALRRGSSETVLIILADVPIGATISQLIEQVSGALDPHGYAVVYRRRRAGQRLRRLVDQIEPAAVVSVAALTPEEEAELTASGVVLVSAALDRLPVGGVRVPQLAVGRVQAEHLVGQGHRVLGYAHPRDERLRMFSEPRLDGVGQVCAEHGLPEPSVEDVPSDGGADAGVRAVQAWRGVAEPVTAVCAYNDETAFAVLAGMRLLSLTAPTDLAVIGVDDVPFARFAAPPLSTVDVHTEQVSAAVTARLLERLVPGEPAREHLTGPVPTLVQRESA